MNTQQPRWLLATTSLLFFLGLVCIISVGGVIVPPPAAAAPLEAPARLSTQAFTSTIPADLPLVGPDIPIYEADNEQHRPAVAYNWRHDEYLVVWHNQWGGGGRDIYARRINGQGKILSWFAVTFGANDRMQPSVAYDPDHDRYLVTWMYDFAGDGSDWDVYGRFIPWSGPDPALTEFPICAWTSSQWSPRVAYNAHPHWPEFLVVWTNLAPGTPATVAGRRVFSGGGFPDINFTIAAHGTDHYANPDVAYNLARNEYLVVFSKNTVDIKAVRLSVSGTILGGGIFDVAAWSDSESRPAVAACHTRDRYFVVWQSLQSGLHFDIYGRFITGTGDLDGAPLHLTWRGINEEEPALISNPKTASYMLVWQEQYSNLSGPYGISGRMIADDKTMGGDFVIEAPYSGTQRVMPAVAVGGPHYLVVWEHDRYGTGFRDIHGRLVWPEVLYLPLLLDY